MTLASLERVTGRLAALDWRRETIYLLTAAMEVAWFTPWYLAFIPVKAQLPPERTAVGLFLVMILPTYGARVLQRLNLKPRLQGLALAALLVMNCLLAMRVFLYAGQAYSGLEWLQETLRDALDIYQFVPDWFIVISSTLFLWWRGIRLGQRTPSVRGITLGFYAGIVSFIAFVLLVSLATREDPSFFVPVFFFYGLMALAATRMDEMRGQRGALRSPFGIFWLLSSALAALSVVFLAVSLGALLTGSDFRSALRWIQPLLLLVGIVLGLFLLLLRAATDWVLGFFRSLGVETDITPLAEFLERLNDLVPEGSATTLQAPPGLTVVRLLLMGGLVLGLGALVIFMLRHQAWGGRVNVFISAAPGEPAPTGECWARPVGGGAGPGGALGVARAVRRTDHPTHLRPDVAAGGGPELPSGGVADPLRVRKDGRARFSRRARRSARDHRSVRRGALR